MAPGRTTDTILVSAVIRQRNSPENVIAQIKLLDAVSAKQKPIFLLQNMSNLWYFSGQFLLI